MADDDPYVYPGTNVLKNKFGITDAAQLEELERQITHQRREQSLAEGKLPVAMTKESYQELHRHLFQDVYEWAGDLRTTELAKGNNLFALQQFVEPSLEKELSNVKNSSLLESTSLDGFADKVARHIAELNAVHPFREGNGRTMRLHLELLAQQAGHDIDTTAIDPDKWNKASIQSMNTDHSMLRDVILDAAKEKEQVTSVPDKQEFFKRVEHAMQQDNQYDVLSQSERQSVAATVAVESALHIEDATVASRYMTHGIELIADARDSVKDKDEERSVLSDTEQLRDSMREIYQTHSSTDVRSLAGRYLPKLDAIVSYEKEESREMSDDVEVDID